jgi:phospholipid-translocating ATPase
MVFTIVQFAYCFYNGSGQSFWSSWPITLFNLIFTFLPVVMRAVFEVDLDIKSNKQTFKEISQGKHDNPVLYNYFPKMYFIGQRNTLFTKLKFFEWFTLGTSQGVICFIITLYSLGTAYDSSGFSSYQSGASFA